jgi:hypothetical protein
MGGPASAAALQPVPKMPTIQVSSRFIQGTSDKLSNVVLGTGVSTSGVATKMLALTVALLIGFALGFGV